jgi:hypothetical protein
MDLGTIMASRAIDQKIPIQKKNRIPVRLTRTRKLTTLCHYHTPHSVPSFFPFSFTIGNRAKKKFPQTRRHPHHVGRPVLRKDVRSVLKQGVLVLLQFLVTIRQLSHNLPVNKFSFPSLQMAGLAGWFAAPR